MALIEHLGEDPEEVLPPIKPKAIKPEHPSALAILAPTVENTGDDLKYYSGSASGPLQLSLVQKPRSVS